MNKNIKIAHKGDPTAKEVTSVLQAAKDILTDKTQGVVYVHQHTPEQTRNIVYRNAVSKSHAVMALIKQTMSFEEQAMLGLELALSLKDNDQSKPKKAKKAKK